MAEVARGSVKDLKPGKYVIIDDEPCKVVGIDSGKSGKHGAAKARVEGISLFTGKKKTLLKPVDADIEIPILEKKSAQIVAVLGNNRLQLMDLQTYEMFEMECPEEFRGKALQGAEVEIQDVMGRKSLIRVKG